MELKMDPEHRQMFAEGKLDDLVRSLENAIKTKLDNAQLKTVLATIYAQKGRNTDAIKLYEELLQKNPDDSGILVNLGFCYMGTDDRKAINLFDRIVQQAKTKPIERRELSLAFTNLGAIYEKYSYFETAYERYATALKVFPENKLAATYLGQLEKMADPDFGAVGLRRLEDGTEIKFLWDGSYFKGRTIDVDISELKLK